MRKLLTLFLALITSAGTMFAEIIEHIQIGNLYYNLDTETKTAEVTYEKSDLIAYSSFPYNYYLTIPSSVTYDETPYTVTKIGVTAFRGVYGINSVSIPNTVKSIDDYAFYQAHIQLIIIPSSVNSIGFNAFYGVYNVNYTGNATGSPWGAKCVNGHIDNGFVLSNDRTTLIAWIEDPLQKNIDIPSTVTTIADGAFKSCSYIETVNIPNGLISIGEDAFSGCTRIKSLPIPNSVISIGSYAFEDVFHVQYNGNATGSPWGARSINGYVEYPLAFSNADKDTLVTCYKYTEGDIVIPNSVSVIGKYAFEDCRYIKSVVIPNSVSVIGNYAFDDVFNIQYHGNATGAPWGAKSMNGIVELPLVYNEDKTTLIVCAEDAEGEIVIANTVDTIVDNAFYGCRNITSVNLPDNLIYVGANAFYSCRALTSIEISNSVTSIGDYAFENCSGLTSATIGNGVISIGGSAFHSCFNLTSVTIGNSVTSIGNAAFYGCTGLTSIVIPNSVTSIGSGAFENCTGLTSVTIGNSVISIGSGAFENCTGLISVEIPNSVTSIGNGAFEKCTGLTSVTIPNNVTSIGERVFLECSSLTSVTIPNNVTSIGNYAFHSCTGLSSVTIGNSVTSIGSWAFFSCSVLTSIEIPQSVTSIANSAFRDCNNLKIVYSKRLVPPTISSSTFSNISSEAIVFVPSERLNAYNNASYWKDLNIQSAVACKSNVAPTSFSVTVNHIPWEFNNNYIVSCSIEGGETFDGNTLEYIGLEPNSEYNGIHMVLTSNKGETETANISFKTTELELTTQPSKPVSSNTAILLAATNMSDAEVSCGFEWRRNDAPEDMASTKVYCPVANGTMAGRLKGLKEDVYYKYRAFYQSAAGNMYYGDWQYIFTGDNTVEFDPVLYTYAPVSVGEEEATLKGYAIAGSDDFTEQGFEYWADSRVPQQNEAPRHMPAALGEHMTVQAEGISMKVTLTDLDPGTVYKYRTYAKIGDQMLYGAEMSFTTKGEYIEEEGGEEALESLSGNAVSPVTKTLRNGQILILRGSHTYTLTGQEVK